MRHPRATQLDLPGTLATEMLLREEIERLRQHPTAALAERDQAQGALDKAARAQAFFRHPGARHAPDLEGALRRLLTLAHPDKWSAGQDAATLAHELTVSVNALREQLREGTL
jgi:hypothetical protein